MHVRLPDGRVVVVAVPASAGEGAVVIVSCPPPMQQPNLLQLAGQQQQAGTAPSFRPTPLEPSTSDLSPGGGTGNAPSGLTAEQQCTIASIVLGLMGVIVGVLMLSKLVDLDGTYGYVVAAVFAVLLLPSCLYVHLKVYLPASPESPPSGYELVVVAAIVLLSHAALGCAGAQALFNWSADSSSSGSYWWPTTASLLSLLISRALVAFEHRTAFSIPPHSTFLPWFAAVVAPFIALWISLPSTAAFAASLPAQLSFLACGVLANAAALAAPADLEAVRLVTATFSIVSAVAHGSGAVTVTPALSSILAFALVARPLGLGEAARGPGAAAAYLRNRREVLHRLAVGGASLSLVCCGVVATADNYSYSGSGDAADLLRTLAPLCPWAALLAGAVAHYSNNSSSLKVQRTALATLSFVASFWTGGYAGLATVPVTAVVWSLLQLPWGRPVDPSAVLDWQRRSAPFAPFTFTLIVCCSSFVIVDWLLFYQFYDTSSGHFSSTADSLSPWYFYVRAVVMLLLPCLAVGVANKKRAELEDSDESDDCLLAAVVVPLLSALASAGAQHFWPLALLYIVARLAVLSFTARLASSRGGLAIIAQFAGLAVCMFTNQYLPFTEWGVAVLAYLVLPSKAVTIPRTSRLMSCTTLIGALFMPLIAAFAGDSNGNCNGACEDYFPLTLLFPFTVLLRALAVKALDGTARQAMRLDVVSAAALAAFSALPYTLAVRTAAASSSIWDPSSDNPELAKFPISAVVLSGVLLAGVVAGAAVLRFSPDAPAATSTHASSADEVSNAENRAAAGDDSSASAGIGAGTNLDPSVSAALATAVDTPVAVVASGIPALKEDRFEETLIIGSAALVGSMEIALPLALAPICLFAMMYARHVKSIGGAVGITVVFCLRALSQIFGDLFGLDLSVLCLIFSGILLLLVLAWPMPDLLDDPRGAPIGILRLCFLALAAMLLGPATNGWAALGATVFVTGLHLRSERGEYRAGLSNPFLYLGSLSMVFGGHFNFENPTSLAAGVVANLCFLFALALRFLPEKVGGGGDNNNTNLTHRGFSHLMVAFALVFGLSSARATSGWGAALTCLLVSVWVVVHKATVAACVVLPTIGMIVVSIMGTYLWSESDAATISSFVAAAIGAKLLLIGAIEDWKAKLRLAAVSEAATATPIVAAMQDSAATPAQQDAPLARRLAEQLPKLLTLENIEGFESEGTTYIRAGGLWIMGAFAIANGTSAMIAASLTILFVIFRARNVQTLLVGLFAGPLVSVLLAFSAAHPYGGLLVPSSPNAIVAGAGIIASLLLAASGKPLGAAEVEISHFVAYVWVVPFALVDYNFCWYLPLLATLWLAVWSFRHCHTLVIGAVLPLVVLLASELSGNTLAASAKERKAELWILVGSLGAFAASLALYSRGPKLDGASSRFAHPVWLPRARSLTLKPVAIMWAVFAVMILLCGVVGIFGVASVASFILYHMFNNIGSHAGEEEEELGSRREALCRAQIGGVTIQITAAFVLFVWGTDEAMLTGIIWGNDGCAACALLCFAGIAVVAASPFFRPALALDYNTISAVVYCWIFAGGMVGSASSFIQDGIGGSLGIIATILTVAWAAEMKQYSMVVGGGPGAMVLSGFFVALAELGSFDWTAMFLPLMVYGLFEIAAAQCVNNVPIEHSFSHIPKLLGSALEVSGWLCAIVGGSFALYFPSGMGLFGALLFVFGLLAGGIFNGVRGVGITGKSGPSSIDLARGVRLRISGLALGNLSIWFGMGLANGVERAVIMIVASLVSIGSGCVMMHMWSKLDVEDCEAARQDAEGEGGVELMSLPSLPTVSSRQVGLELHPSASRRDEQQQQQQQAVVICPQEEVEGGGGRLEVALGGGEQQLVEHAAAAVTAPAAAEERQRECPYEVKATALKSGKLAKHSLVIECSLASTAFLPALAKISIELKEPLAAGEIINLSIGGTSRAEEEGQCAQQ